MESAIGTGEYYPNTSPKKNILKNCETKTQIFSHFRTEILAEEG